MSKIVGIGMLLVLAGTSVVAWSKSNARIDAVQAVGLSQGLSVMEIQRKIDTGSLLEHKFTDMSFVQID